MAPSAPPPPSDDALSAQLAARDAASRDDAAVLGSRRSVAAARALGLDLPEGRLPAVPLAAATPLPTPVAPPPGPASAEGAPPVAPPSPPAPPTDPTPDVHSDAATEVDAAPRPLPPGVVLPVGGPAPAATGVLARARTAPPRSATDDALLELRPTVLASDVDRIGDQLVVLRDRLELRDRHGGLRRTVPVVDVADVEVQRRLTSAVLVVTTRTATDMVIKGLKPETAESARRTILDLCPTEASPPAPVDERSLLRAVMELHRAGVLDDREVADKTALIAHLAGRRAPA